MKNRILKLEPFYSEKIWGYEEWILSTHRNGHSKIKNSDTILIDYIKEELPILNNIMYTHRIYNFDCPFSISNANF